MQLSDISIVRALESGLIKIDPYQSSLVQPASIDVRLGDKFILADDTGRIDPPMVTAASFCDVAPNTFLLGHTMEHITLPSNIAGRIEGKSTWGRRGLLIHAAGFIDPGFSGQLTLEIKNLTRDRFIRLHPGEPIAQISFHELDRPAVRPYGDLRLNSHYQGQTGPTRPHRA